MKHHSKMSVLAWFLVPGFFVFFCIGSLQAASAEQAKSKALTSAPVYKMEDLKITKETTTVMKPETPFMEPKKVTHRKVNLLCIVKPYYDSKFSKPILGHVWDLDMTSVPGYAPPWYVYWEVWVTNEGTAPAKNYNVHFEFSNPVGMKPSYQYFDETQTLAPGETAVTKYRLGPFGPGASMLYDKSAWLNVYVDFPPRIGESIEIDNHCSSFVDF